MFIQLIRTLELLSAACTNNLDLPLMHLFDVTIEVIFVNKCRAPVPGAFYFILYLANLCDGDGQLLVGSG